MRQFGIFAKYWRPGTVKTRLAATVGADLAAEFHRVCLETLLMRLDGVAQRHVLAVWPPEDRAEFQAISPASWNLAEQAGGDLGSKMAAYFEAALAAGATKTVLIGADSPTISPDVIQKAFGALDDNDVVLGPCDDGGYYLVGCRAPLAPIWDGVAWSTPDVWPQTIKALRQAQRTWHELPQGFDVDRIDDVRRLNELLGQSRFVDSSWNDLREVCHACLRCLPDPQGGSLNA